MSITLLKKNHIPNPQTWMRRKMVCDSVWSRYKPFHYRTISLRDKVLTTYGDDNWATCAHSLLHPPTRPLGLPASWHLIQWDSCWEQRSRAAVDIKPWVFSLSLLKNQDMEANEVRDHGNHNNDVSRGWISHSVSLCGPGLVSGWLFTQTSILLPLNWIVWILFRPAFTLLASGSFKQKTKTHYGICIFKRWECASAVGRFCARWLICYPARRLHGGALDGLVCVSARLSCLCVYE